MAVAAGLLHSANANWIGLEVQPDYRAHHWALTYGANAQHRRFCVIKSKKTSKFQ